MSDINDAQKQSLDPAVQEMIGQSRSREVTTVWDRHAVMQPQCGFGKLGSRLSGRRAAFRGRRPGHSGGRFHRKSRGQRSAESRCNVNNTCNIGLNIHGVVLNRFNPGSKIRKLENRA